MTSDQDKYSISLHHNSIFSNTNIKSIPHPSLIYVLILRFVLVRQSSSLAMVRHPRSFKCFIFTPVHQIIDNNGMVHDLSLFLFKIQHLGILYKKNPIQSVLLQRCLGRCFVFNLHLVIGMNCINLVCQELNFVQKECIKKHIQMKYETLI